MSLDRYQLGYIVAEQWNDDMAQRFPNADHTGCRQLMWHDGERWHSYKPAKCSGWHCNRCGAPTNMFGHHDCPDRPPS